MMDDLISRKAILNEAKRLSGPITGDGWDNWGVYGLIERQPSIPAVPLEPLCKFLAHKDCMSCRVCDATIGPCEGEEAYDVCDSKERWKEILTKWMEALDATN